MSAEFREGRPAIAPMRKEHEKITGEELDWQLAEVARNELDDSEVEMCLLAKSDQCDDCGQEREDIYEEIMQLDVNEIDHCLASDSVAAGLCNGYGSESTAQSVHPQVSWLLDLAAAMSLRRSKHPLRNDNDNIAERDLH